MAKNHALIGAASNGHVAVVDRLLAEPRVDVTIQENKALISAAYGGHLAVLNRLLAVPGVDVTARSHAVIHTAVSRSQSQIVSRLLTVPEVDVMVGVQAAIAADDWLMMELLLSHPKAAREAGLDPCHSALMRHFTAVQMCSKNGTSKELQRNLRRMHGLAYGVVRADGGCLPFGVNELVCEYVVGSNGFAQWALGLHREVRQQLRQLESINKTRKKLDTTCRCS
eukprot:TRINITY_DN4556_c0_g2_i7.p1 TRINITY_DN4556_c0_g2~~TRINITY_DN4556_c0_g2_i7.p1  ORF type:complete len:225 (-),score=22.60 TRINITY_DN4556_c0_g2_i7:125-799(-)